MVAASRESAAISLWFVRPLLLLLLFFASTAIGTAQGQTDFEGRIIAGIEFDPPGQPLPRAELDRVLPLHAGSALHAADVRAALQALYLTGRYLDVSVDAEPKGTGVELRILTAFNYFVSGVNLKGVNEPPNREQLVNATKLDLGTLFSDSQLPPAMNDMQELLRANGLYRAEVNNRVERTPATEEASIYFDIDAGKRARFDGVNLLGSFVRSRDSVIKDTGFHRSLGPFQLPGWRELTQTRLDNGIARVRDKFQKGDHLEASVTLEKLDYNPETNRVRPTLRIDAGPIVDLNVTGAKVSAGRLRQLIPVYQERTVDRSLLVEGRRNLVEYLQSQGYFQAQVDFSENHPAPDRFIIDYQVTRGMRSKLVNIDITGNKFFDTATLRERMSITPARFLRYEWGRFSQQLLDRDQNTIQDLYQANGFREAEVSSQVIQDYRGKPGDLSVLLRVNEGPQWLVHNLTIEGISDADERYLRSILQSADGEPFSEANIAADRDTILSYYYNDGYPNATFDWTQSPGPSPTQVDLRFVIRPGMRLYVRRVLVRGLETTKPAVVANRITLAPGDPISQSRIAESQQKLYDLGIFSQVQTAIQNPDGVEDSKYVLFHLTEARRYSFNVGFGAELGRIGGGVTTLDAPAGTPGFSPRFSLGISRINFRGLGHTVSLQTLLSTVEQRGLFTYLVPQFTGNENLALTYSFLVDNSSDIRTFTAHRLEGSVQLSQKLSRANGIQYRYTFRRATIDQSTLKISPELIPILAQPDRAGLFAISFVQDRRDDPTNTHTGIYNTVDVGGAWSGFGSETDFTRLLFRNATYYRLSRNVVLAREVQFGYIQLFGGLPEIPLAERFYSGGSNSNRAFPDNQAGPRDLETGFPLGGNALLFHSTELRFPLIGDNLGGVLFHDIGNVYSSITDISFRFHQRNRQDFNYGVQAIGFGIRYRTPIGPLRADFSLSPNSPFFVGYSGTLDQLLNNQGTPNVPQRISVFQFHFSLGQTF
jgi:outer membrane protein insertion porin family